MQIVVKDGMGGILNALSFVDLYNKKFRVDLENWPIRLHFICSAPVLDAITPLIPLYSFTDYRDSTSDLDLAAKLRSEYPDDKVYILTPDFFGTVAGYSIDSTGITWRDVLENRFLKNNFRLHPDNKNVFLALLSAQNNNTYPWAFVLIAKLCESMPDYKFYYADVHHWNGANIELDLNLNDLGAKYSNFLPYRPESLRDDILWLAGNVKFFLGTDNGVMNFAYCLGRERILLDSRYGNKAFEMRWRHNGFRDSIPITTSPADIALKFKLLAKNPELSNISKVDINSELFDLIGYKTKQCFNL